MKRITKKYLSLLLVVLMLVGSFSACGNNAGVDNGNNPASTPEATKAPDGTDKPESTPTPEPTREPDATPTPTPSPTPTLSPGEQLAADYAGFVETPTDLGGRTIKFVTTIQKRYKLTNDDRDQTDNDTLAIVDALELIEQDYNCTIEIEQLKAKALVTALLTAKASGDTYCDILEFGCSDTYLEQIYAANLCMPLEDERIADIIKLDTNPWLPASQFGQMFGHQYGVHFKTNNSGDIIRNCLMFNKDLVEKYQLGNIYEMVANKTWTFDKLMEMSASILTQSDGAVSPLVYNKEGIFMPMVIYANGGTVADYIDGKYIFTGLSDSTLAALNFAVDMKTKGYLHPKCDASGDAETAFINGEAVFYAGIYASLKNFTTGTTPCEYNVGLLPMPIGPNNASGEYGAVTYTEHLWHVINNVEEPEKVAALMVAIANRTGKQDVIESELMTSLQDMESADMLELMYNNMTIDYSRSISTTRSLVQGANKTIMNLEATPKEKYEEIASKAQTIFDELKLAEDTETTTE